MKKTCTNYVCKEARLVRVWKGKSLQTKAGLIVNKSPGTRYICPMCGAMWEFGRMHYLGKNMRGAALRR